MEINLPALEFALIFTAVMAILIWILEDFWMKRQERKLAGKCNNMEIHVSKSENLHVDKPSSQVTSDIRETVPESLSAKEDLVKYEHAMQPVSTLVKVESTGQSKLSCPQCGSKVVKRGFADKAHRKQRYLSARVFRRTRIVEVEKIEKEEREILKIVGVRCRFCSDFFDDALDKCPNCGGTRAATPTIRHRQWTIVTKEKELK